MTARHVVVTCMYFFEYESGAKPALQSNEYGHRVVGLRVMVQPRHTLFEWSDYSLTVGSCVMNVVIKCQTAHIMLPRIQIK